MFIFKGWQNSTIILVLVVIEIYNLLPHLQFQKSWQSSFTHHLARISENLLLIIGVLKVKRTNFLRGRQKLKNINFIWQEKSVGFFILFFKLPIIDYAIQTSHKYVLPNWHAYWPVEIVFKKLILSKWMLHC